MLQKDTIQLLRFPFSLFLLPVYLFAVSQLNEVNWLNAFFIFFVLHFLVYPSSNGYNSYMDRDTTPIGGLKNPPPPSEQLFWTTVVMDVVAVTISLSISIYFSAGVLLYILASRAYSYRGIRLKKYPVTGYLTVIVFQGMLSFFLSYHGSSADLTLSVPSTPMLCAACLIGGYYPLTQVYQHEEDKKDGVQTISMLLGVKGTFIFSGCLFALATGLMFITFRYQTAYFIIFTGCMLPALLFFANWTVKVWQHEKKADFRNSLLMNVLASVCTAVCFITLIILKQFE
jgi:1,4-dihydroxy-2-naphthoate octaprenyltransferase